MAAEMQKYGLSNQLPDIPQILLEAQNRWLRPTEICQILSNYQKFSIAPEPPNRPQSGSLFLFDRKILRYFRKDGHIWRKKKDGKTVKEAHEKLKVGSVDVLHCYYAHGEENENFQRRTYWLLEEGFMNIVLVHYLEIKGGKQSSSRAKEGEESAWLSNADSPACSNSFASQSQVASQPMDAESPISGQISEYEDAETDNCRASSRYHPFVEMQQPVDGLMMDNLLGAPAPITSVNLGYQGEIQRTTANLDDHFVIHHDIASVFNEVGAGLRSGSKTQLDSAQFSEPFPGCPTGYLEPTLYSSVATMGYDNLDDNSRLETFTTEALYTNNFTQKETDALSAAGMTASQMPNDSYTDGSTRYPLLKQSSLDVFKIEPNGLKKFDSFSRWMSDELAEVADLDIKSSSDAFWSSTDTVNVADGSNIPINEHLDAYVVSPSLSQDQLFSIIDVSPSWAYTSSKIKVLITGTFLTNKEDVENCKWSCMFGDVEVPAEVLADGSLRCYTPVHQSGRVPFYVTCSNRVACSEVREFEFRDSETQYMETADLHTTGINEMHLHIRLEKLLSLGPDDYEKYVLADGHEKSELINTISSLMLDDKISDLALSSNEKEFSAAQDKNLEKLVKEKLYSWLIHKIHDDGKGPNVLGKEGQGVIHLVAALGYDWAIRPIITAGVHVNFRDARGWTALHWAASCGRERTVGALITNGAASGALTDPTPQFPSGRTPADLASENGYKGIAGFLAESALISHLSALTLKESKGGNVEEIRGLAEEDDFAESSSAQLACQDSKEEPLKDSLSAVRKSTQAAARIFQAFRVESFHRKKVVEYGDDDCGLSDERTLSLVSLKNAKPGQNDMPHSAAVRIQNKFRGWKGKKEFMIIRQKIIKIQAHVRGHQVRRNYRKIVWSVGIVEKVILRWRRKGRGLRGFQPEKQLEGPWQIQPAKGEDEYDFLKDVRKQAEGRLQRGLDRVKSMTQYPEAREQYSRLQTCVTELQESKAEMSSWLGVTSPMEACMSSSLGAMGPVLRKLDSLLLPQYWLSMPLQDGIRLLKEDLEEISAALHEQSTVHSPNEMSNYWMNEVREISYDINDFLDDMMLRHTKIRYVRRHRVGRVKTAWRLKTLKPCTRAAKIAELRALVREASERHDMYLDGCTTSPRCVSTTGHGQTPALHAVAANYLVGIDDSKTNLVQLLTDETEQQLKVVAIVGPAGVGKTTLANQVYRELEEQFECRAFVQASRKPDVRRLLAGILSQVQQCSGPSDSCTVQDLIDNLIKHLQDKRYVIVIDDLWETIAWDIVTSAFPEGNNCSRIVTTAQIEGVALECCDYQSNNVLKMKPLAREDSMKLLFNMVFGPERSCPEQLKEVSDITITKCAGLPLAIICVAGLLASQPDNSEVPQHVQGYLCSNLSANSNLEETLQEILKLSYNSLPHYLKTCLMYLSMYPEGYTMWKDDLVKQWVAECFISATEGQDIEEVAECYFDELVNRGMIQPVEISYADEVLSCTVHQVLLDLITHKSNEEKFITALDYSQTITGLYRKARRLTLHFSNTRYATKPAALTLSKLRSLAFFGMLKCMPSFGMLKRVPSIVKFKLLRVLILEFWGDLVGGTSIDLRGICRLFQLRYLKVSGDVSIEVELPARMRRLQYLETLKINARVSAVPLDLPGLLHLSLGDETKVPYGIGRVRSLRTLQYFDLGKNSKKSVLSLGELINLQDLRLTYSIVNSPKLLKRKLAALASSIAKLVNLKSVTLAPGALDTAIYHDCSSRVFSPPVFLQRLELLSPVCIFSRIPEWIGQLNKLCILKVVVSELLMKDMDMLTGLPALTILALYVRQPTTESIIFKREAFPALKYFKYTCGVLSLVFQEEALPNLHRLELSFNAHRGERYGYLLAGIEHLPNLKEITGTIGPAAGAEERDIRAADSAFKDTIRKHPRFPSYDSVKRVDRVDEEYNLRSQEDAIKCAASG